MSTNDHPTRSPRRARRLLLLATLLAVLATGCNVRAMGANLSGQLGDATTTQRPAPVRPTGTTTFVQVSAGGDHTCGVAEAGTLFCWGESDRGQVGVGSTPDKPEPTQVGTANDWISVSAGAKHTCGIRTAERKIFCWGLNDDGQAQPGGPRGGFITPIDTGLGVGYTAISAGERHTCAVQDASRLFCWGFNGDGRLGAGDSAAIPFARRVTGISWRSVSASVHTCGVESTGTLRCWGPNDQGQLGVGDREGSNGPRTVAGNRTWAAVDTGQAHTCGREVGGGLQCWGDGSRGQLGTGSVADRIVPIVVQTGSRWVDVSAGAEHTCAVLAPAMVRCWGRNADGQLGDGTTVDRRAPTPVVGAADIDAVAVSAGGRHTHIVVRPDEGG
jgi:alpha-tubulin suppressor-like RCC1 family protein